MSTTLEEGGAPLSAAERKTELLREEYHDENRKGQCILRLAKATQAGDNAAISEIENEIAAINSRTYRRAIAILGPKDQEEIGLDYQIHAEERRVLVAAKVEAQANVQRHAAKIREAREKLHDAEQAYLAADAEFRHINNGDPGLHEACRRLNIHKAKYPEIHVEGEE